MNDNCSEKSCPCPRKGCERLGKCCLCIAHHRNRKTLVYCMRGLDKKDKKAGKSAEDKKKE